MDELAAMDLFFYSSRFLYLNPELWPTDVTDLSKPPGDAEKEMKPQKTKEKAKPTPGAKVNVSSASSNSHSDELSDFVNPKNFKTLTQYLKFRQVMTTYKDRLKAYVEEIREDRKTATFNNKTC